MHIYKFKIYGHDYETKVIRRDESEIVIEVNGEQYKAFLEPTKRQLSAKPTPKITRPVTVPGGGTPITAKPTDAKGANIVKSPLPGLVLKLKVKEGDAVKIGDPVLVMEAMKMENTIAATMDGTIAKVLVKEGESILEGAELVAITPAG
ncbi:acetyl-CoA carboxylase biotin carboxyl carrier protein subunit [bacterium]|nr:acetyl-CoA carboxylase biotin carboxyl carrier protein subunit [bacterium]MBU1882467.1 acetyl-CoA carboxylase biotin carboxyl carrier protein subunit [bacterium]